MVWDCGTGNGQAAIDLVKHFDRVVATDGSTQQITQAYQHPQINYWVSRAEAISLRTGSVDLVTVAIAVHWFALDQFYREVKRVLSPDGVLAVWTYHLPTIKPDIDQTILHYYHDVVGNYWPEQFHHVDEGYAQLPFPFAELTVPQFEMTTEWNLEQVSGFLDSWSATRLYEKAHNQHPLKHIWQELTDAWGKPSRKLTLRWPLHLRVGRVIP